MIDSFLSQSSVSIALLIALAYLAFEDFKYRAVSLYTFLTIGILFIFYNLVQKFNAGRIIDIALNNLFISLLLFFLSIYFSLKERVFTNITKKYLGWGDIIFFYELCLVFSPLNYIVFFVGSLLFSLLLTILFNILNNFCSKTIPLAGYQAVFLILTLLLSKLFPIFDLTIDTYWYILLKWN